MPEERDDLRSTPETSRRPGSPATVQLLEWLLAGVLLWVLCVPLGDFFHRPRRPMKCRSNLRQIAHALAAYEYACKSFPPAYVSDVDGRPMHSWRVLILPYLGPSAQQLFDEYDFSEPWNGPHNIKLAKRCPDVFLCPEDVQRNHRSNDGVTNYVAVVGAETAWPGEHAIRPRDITDGTVFTLLVVEVAGSGINWLEPRDLRFAEMSFKINGATGKGTSSAHPGCARVAFADGRVSYLDDSLKAETVRGLLTRNAGENVEAY